MSCVKGTTELAEAVKTAPDGEMWADYKMTPMPDHIKSLPLDPVRRVPVPWFVAWIDGKPEFRVADGDKLGRAIQHRLCWVCGQKLGKHMVFLLGPMCGINRVSAEAPCHLDCAEWSTKNCPFLAKPHMHRRDPDGVEAMGTKSAGLMIKRNPGCTLLWTTTSYKLISDNGGVLFRVGDPTQVSWWKEGRTATRAEVMHSIETGLPILRGQASSPEAQRLLNKMIQDFVKYLPKEVGHAARL
jgi:hypothetical protein